MLIHTASDAIFTKKKTKEEEIHIGACEKDEVCAIILYFSEEHMYGGYSRENFEGIQGDAPNFEYLMLQR